MLGCGAPGTLPARTDAKPTAAAESSEQQPRAAKNSEGRRKTMRAVVVEQWGGAENLVEREIPRPEPG